MLAHLAAAWVMAGLIWVIQVVHYPLFDRVAPDRFVDFEAEHARRITLVLAGPMPLQLVLALWLAASPPGGVGRGLVLVNLAAVGLALVVTAAVSAPLHGVLGRGFDPAAHRRLVATNLVRTAAWTAAAASATAIAASALAVPAG